MRLARAVMLALERWPGGAAHNALLGNPGLVSDQPRSPPSPGTTYIYIKYNNLYIMAVTQRNSNAAMILLFLYRLVEVRGTPSAPLPSPPRYPSCLRRSSFGAAPRDQIPLRYALSPLSGPQGLLQGARGGVDPG